MLHATTGQNRGENLPRSRQPRLACPSLVPDALQQFPETVARSWLERTVGQEPVHQGLCFVEGVSLEEERRGAQPEDRTCADALGRHPVHEALLESGGSTVGLIVDSVDEVRNLPTDTIEPPSPIVTTVDSDFLMGVGRLEQGEGQQRLVILLDLNRVTSLEEQQRLAALSAEADLSALPE